MDYKEKYEQALERAKKLYEQGTITESLGYVFPELNESYNEKIRKELIEHIKANKEADYVLFKKFSADDVIAWLEKQGKQEGKSALEAWKEMRLEVYQQASGNRHEPNYSDDSTKMFSLNDIDEIIEKISEQSHDDKIKPKFHEGDWIISNNKKSIYQVIEVKRGIYVIRDNVDNHVYHIGIEECEKSGRLWSINDAKDGDVLVSSSGKPFIFKGFFNNDPMAYGGLVADDSFWPASNSNWTTVYCKPATKEQRDILFQKMHEAGYEWDAEKKELKKIEPKKLDPDKVIEWLHYHIQVDEPKIEYNEDGQPLSESFLAHAKARCIAADEVVNKFKKDFNL